ncbi:hypothetical protein Bca52824_031035 [Brassica carinata]|uniref:Uncharacterized protein n=1 Tax=Brassica carinata TaxID=52824 RepID=A0A8X7V4X5_BRACI|nr:hypothetical protein Bca52824_031035 [Brassica carinata]
MSVSLSCSSIWVCLSSPAVILGARYVSPASPCSLWLFSTVVAAVACFRSGCCGLGCVNVSSGAFGLEVRLELGAHAELAPGELYPLVLWWIPLVFYGDCLLPGIILDLLDSTTFHVSLTVLAAANFSLDYGFVVPHCLTQSVMIPGSQWPQVWRQFSGSH